MVKDGILLVVEHLTVTEWVKELVQLVTAECKGKEFSQVKNARAIRKYKCICKNEVISFDAETGILVLKGSVSGANGSLGKIKGC